MNEKLIGKEKERNTRVKNFKCLVQDLKTVIETVERYNNKTECSLITFLLVIFLELLLISSQRFGRVQSVCGGERRAAATTTGRVREAGTRAEGARQSGARDRPAGGFPEVGRRPGGRHRAVHASALRPELPVRPGQVRARARQTPWHSLCASTSSQYQSLRFVHHQQALALGAGSLGRLLTPARSSQKLAECNPFHCSKFIHIFCSYMNTYTIRVT